MACAVLVLHAERHPEPGIEARGNARRQLLAAIALVGAVLVERLPVVFDAGRGLQAPGLAFGHHHGRADGVAGVDGRIRAVQGIDPFDGLGVDHVPARRIKSPEKVGDQIAIQVHQRPARLQRAKAASANIGIAVAQVALAHGGAGQQAGRVFRVEDVLRLQLLRRFAGGAVGQVGVQLRACFGHADGLQLGFGGNALGQAPGGEQSQGGSQRGQAQAAMKKIVQESAGGPRGGGTVTRSAASATTGV